MIASFAEFAYIRYTFQFYRYRSVTRKILRRFFLTPDRSMSIPVFIVKNSYSTAEVATAIGVGKSTLLRWLQSGQLADPKRETFGGVESRIWSETDLARAKAFREQRYRRRS